MLKDNKFKKNGNFIEIGHVRPGKKITRRAPTIIGNALTAILLFSLESSGIAFNVCVVNTQKLSNKVNSWLKNRFRTLKSRNLG